MRILIGTKNRGKIIEIEEALSGLNLTFHYPHDLGIADPEETGNTFEENAKQKSAYYFEKSGLPTIADDSGIIVEALKNELGIHTRRWGAGPKASDDEWITFFLERMKHEANKRAEFLCVLTFTSEVRETTFFEGRCSGVITETLEAEFLPGLPISACFRPDGYEKVFSALSLEQKNSTSHRGRALQQFREYIEQIL